MLSTVRTEKRDVFVTGDGSEHGTRAEAERRNIELYVVENPLRAGYERVDAEDLLNWIIEHKAVVHEILKNG